MQSVVHDFIAGGPQFGMSQQDDMDAYQTLLPPTQFTGAPLPTQHTQRSPYPL